MKYDIIEQPITKSFSDCTKNELIAYNQWYHNNIEKRIMVLNDYIYLHNNFKSLVLDYSPDSLKYLSTWMEESVEKINLTASEKHQIIENTKLPLRDVLKPNDRLSNLSFQFCFDIGMYIGQIFVKNNSNLFWTQPLNGRKDYISYGRPVIGGFLKKMEYDPTQIIVTMAYGSFDKLKGTFFLYDNYKYWIDNMMEKILT